MKTLTAFISLIRPFWNTRKALHLWFLLAAALIFEIAFVQVSVWINTWNKTFYDALAEFDAGTVPSLLSRYVAFMVLAVAVIVMGNWFGKKLCFSWRDSMTAAFQRRWMANHTHYRLRFHGEPDNPDQRIAEDIDLLAEKSVRLIRNLVLNIARLTAFIAILWAISGVQTVNMAGTELKIHGYMVWIALAYAIAATIALHLIGRHLRPLNIDRQHREADYRATLLRVRDHGEQIAFHRGEEAEIDRMDRRFDKIRHNWRNLIFQELKVECFSFTQMRVAWFIPIVATLPLYLGKVITLGDMMQAQSAFSSVLAGFSWLLNYYREISEWSAVVQRLSEFSTSLDASLPHEKDQSTGMVSGAGLSVSNMSVADPFGNVLLDNISIETLARDWLLLEGPSGTGKTTFLRSLAGLWPYCSGRVCLAENTMFLPQDAYLPLDEPRRILAYPRRQPFGDREVSSALRDVGLGHLLADLDGKKPWRDTLSGGERQRLVFARILLHRPDIVIADEPTSHLDPRSAIALLRLIRQRLPDLVLVGVCHQPELKGEFSSVMTLGTPTPRPVHLQYGTGT